MKQSLSYEVIRSYIKITNDSTEYDLIISEAPQPRKRLHKDVMILSANSSKVFEKGEIDELCNLSFKWTKSKNT